MAQSDFLVQQKYLTGVSSVVGDTRRQYEDRANLTELQTASGLNLLVAIVADGVGSADNGGLAAQLSINSVLTYMTENEETEIPLLISNALKYANFVVYKDVITRNVDASTTLTVGVFYKDRFFVGNVGDSRAYWIQESGKVVQLTKDHTYYNIKGGDPNSSQAEALVNAIGIRKEIYADIGLYVQGPDRQLARKIGTQGLPLKVGDTILLCSDGLIKDDLQGERFVKEEEIVQALQTEIQPNAAAVKMTGIAEGRYVDDNVSVITVQHTTPNRIENVLAKQRKKGFIQKLAYAGMGLLVLAGIITGAILMGENRKAQKKIHELANRPPQTPIVHTAVSSPTPTTEIRIPAGHIQVMSIGYYDVQTGYKLNKVSGNDNPLWSTSTPFEETSPIIAGNTHLLSTDINVKTFGETGAMFSVGSRDIGGLQPGNNQIYAYGGSDLLIKDVEGVTEISLSQGALYLKMVGRTEIAEITFPNHDQAIAKLVGGSALLDVDFESITFWCLSEECDLEVNDQFQRLKQGQIRVYNHFDSRFTESEDYMPPSYRYEEYLLWNNKCNQCLPYDHVPSPTLTPSPTPIIYFTPTPETRDEHVHPTDPPVTPEPRHALTVNVTGKGSVDLSPPGGTYEDGTEVTLTAKPDEGYQFVSWSGDASGSDNPLTVTISKNMTITATFEEIPAETFTLTVKVSGKGSVTPNGGTYEVGKELTLIAKPE